MDEKDLVSAARQIANTTLARSIQSAGQYAVEINPAEAQILRSQLTRLAEIAEHAATPEDYESVHASVCGELRGYRDRAARELTRMRAEVEAAAAAMQSLADAVASSGAGHEQYVQKELAKLEQAAQGENIEELRSAVGRATRAIRASCDDVVRANAATIAQLRDEIRTLHIEVERERRSQWIDRVTGGWNRLKADTKIKDLIRMNQPFCVFLAGLNHLETTGSETPSAALREEVIRSMLSRLEGVAGEDALIGRWSDDVFAVIIDVPRGALPTSVERLQAQVSGIYTIQRADVVHELRATAKAALVERAKGMDETQLYPKLGQAAFAVIAS